VLISGKEARRAGRLILVGSLGIGIRRAVTQIVELEVGISRHHHHPLDSAETRCGS